ncbi:MAG: hypothetical protein ACKOFG_02395 [Limnohabitans sp.]
MKPIPALSAICLSLLCLAPVQPLHAQTPENAPAPEALAAATYISAAGDTLEKIVAKQYAGSPLHTALLVRHLHEANAAVLGKTSARQRLKPGSALRIPEHARLVQQVLAAFLPPPQEPPKPDHSPEARRRWVHYP